MLGDELDPARVSLLIVAERGQGERLGPQAGFGGRAEIAGEAGELEGGFLFLLVGGKGERRLEAGIGKPGAADGGDGGGIGEARDDGFPLLGRGVFRHLDRGKFAANTLAELVERRLEIRLFPAEPVLAQANLR